MVAKSSKVTLVAAAVRRAGLHPFPGATAGRLVNLFAATPDCTRVVPVKVVDQEREPGLNLLQRTAERLAGINAVVAFFNNGRTWYVPIAAFYSVAENNPERTDRIYIPRSKRLGWLEQYLDDRGLRNALRTSPVVVGPRRPASTG